MTHREQTLAANTLLVERASNVVTMVVTCDTVERAKELYDQVCCDASDGFLVLDLETVPRPVLDGQALPREPRRGED